MQGKDFIQIAGELSGGQKEGHWRSAASRAYYAAFHASADSLKNHDLHIPRNAEAHNITVECLAHSGDDTLREAASGLGTLRVNRNRADYDFDKEAFSQNQARLDVALAKIVIGSIEKSPLSRAKADNIVAAIKCISARPADLCSDEDSSAIRHR